MQGPMVDYPQAGVVPDRPAALLGAQAEIHILVIKEVILIESAQISITVLAHEQATARHPGNGLGLRNVVQAILTAGARQGQAG